MIERVCRACQAGNPIEAEVCAQCGAALEGALEGSAPLARQGAPASLAARLRQSPILRNPKARTLALGVAALALEVGAALVSKQRGAEAGTAIQKAPSASGAIGRAFLRRREWEEFDADGNLRRRVVEQLIIRDE